MPDTNNNETVVSPVRTDDTQRDDASVVTKDAAVAKTKVKPDAPYYDDEPVQLKTTWQDWFKEQNEEPQETEEQKKKRLKREKWEKAINAIGDFGTHIANIWGASKGATPISTGGSTLSGQWKERYDKMLADRKATRDQYNAGLDKARMQDWTEYKTALTNQAAQQKQKAMEDYRQSGLEQRQAALEYKKERDAANDAYKAQQLELQKAKFEAWKNKQTGSRSSRKSKQSEQHRKDVFNRYMSIPNDVRIAVTAYAFGGLTNVTNTLQQEYILNNLDAIKRDMAADANR